MRCPVCGSEAVTVYGTRRVDESGRLMLRYRRCLACGAAWKTYEEMDARTLRVADVGDGQDDGVAAADRDPDQG